MVNSIADESLGQDLLVFDNLEAQADRHRPHDLATQERPAPAAPSQATSAPRDLATVAGVANLQQALLLRFLTPAGELADLGHPCYGSRLFELLGEPNNERTRNRAKLHVLQALAEEHRIQSVHHVKVTPNPARPSQIDIALSLTPIGESGPLNLVFPFFLQ